MAAADPWPRQDGSEAIVVEDVHKRFGAVEAVRGISFGVHQGELFGLLGPNGAGKTTFINLLSGLARPDTGSICIGGIDCRRDPKAAQHLIGVVPDESNLYPELTGFENLCFCASLYGMRQAERRARAHELLEMFGLLDAAQRKFGGYSRGMRRRLAIAAGIVHRPALLFLDEPTTGIDVIGARQIRQLVADLHRGGSTVFLTTHHIEEAEWLCQRVAFIVAGQIVRLDSVGSLLEPAETRQTLLLAAPNAGPDVCARLVAAFPDLECQAADGEIRVRSAAPVRVAPLVRFLEEQGVEVIEARRLRPTLEEVFVRITGVAAEAMRKEKEGEPRGREGA